MPVHADIPRQEVIFLDEPDRMSSPMKVKGVAELGIILGWKTCLTAFLLAGFTLLSAFIFHLNFGDQIQMIMFLKIISITGGFLLLMADGAGPLSLDHRFSH